MKPLKTAGLSLGLGILPLCAVAQADRLVAAFDSIDADSDGIVTKAEFEAAGQARLNQADANGDRRLDPAEFERMVRAANSGPAGAGRIARMFDRLDRNGDGFLDADERPSIPTRVFDTVDQNGDGQITRAEAAAHRAQRDG